MNTKPLVSICIPVYNSAFYLRSCLDSIASQTYSPREVIIADDGSSDGSIDIAAEYVQNYGFKLHRNGTNLGAAKTSSKLIEMAAGEYIALYHSDDVYESTIVEESAAVLSNDATIGLVGTMASIIDEHGNRLSEFKLHDAIKSLNKKTYSFDETMLGMLKNAGHDIFLVTPSIMARKNVYREVGGFDTRKYRSAYDYEMWLRMATKHRVAILDKRLMHYRIHKNQISESQIRKNLEVQDILWVIRDYRQLISSRRLKKYCDRMLDKWLFRTAKKQNYNGMFLKSSETLNLVESPKYAILKSVVRLFNTMKITMKKTKSAYHD